MSQEPYAVEIRELKLSDVLLRRSTDVQSFALVHLVSKLGTATNDAATSLKLLEKGLSKEDLALAVLIDFPFQILFGWLAARWSSGDKPLRPVSPPEALRYKLKRGVNESKTRLCSCSGYERCGSEFFSQ